MKFSLKALWKPLATHAAAIGAGAIAVGALATIGPCRAFNEFALATGGSSWQTIPGKAVVAPPALPKPKWAHKPPAPYAKPIPHLEPKNPKDLAKLDKKLGLDGELGRTKDVISSAKLPSGTEVYTVAPRDGNPAETLVYEPKVHFGGRLFLGGDGVFDFKGKVLTWSAGLYSDIIRVGRTQVSLGPGFIYHRETGTTGALLVRTTICLMKCGG